MGNTKAEQDMRAAFEVMYPGPSHSGDGIHIALHALTWRAFCDGAQYERGREVSTAIEERLKRGESPTANPGLETDATDAKCQQGAGE